MVGRYVCGGRGGGGAGCGAICTERKFDESGASPVFSSILQILPVMVTSEGVLGLLSWRLSDTEK